MDDINFESMRKSRDLFNPKLITRNGRKNLSSSVLEKNWNNSVVPNSLHFYGERRLKNPTAVTLIPNYTPESDPHLRPFFRRVSASRRPRSTAPHSGGMGTKPSNRVLPPVISPFTMSSYDQSVVPTLHINRSQQILDLKVIFKKHANSSSSNQRAQIHLYVGKYRSTEFADFTFIYDRGFNVTNEHYLSQGQMGLRNVSSRELLELLRLLTCKTTIPVTEDPDEDFLGPFLLDWPSYLVLATVDADDLPKLQTVHGLFYSAQTDEDVVSLRNSLKASRPMSPQSRHSPGHNKGRTEQLSGEEGNSGERPSMQSFASFLLSLVGSRQHVFLVRTKCFRLS
eukprot:PhF_6_TR1485/c0_g1_i1/m.2679